MKPTLTEQDFADAAGQLGCEVAAIKAVSQVEAPRGGFNPDGTPVTLFEGHKFHKFTSGAFDGEAPDLSYPTWTRKHYGKNWQAEQTRLQRAMELDREAALESASWGKFQIMGFNYAPAGFGSLQAFINAMYQSEGRQLDAFVSFIQHEGMAVFLREKRWADLARRYNGQNYAINKYDTKLAAAYKQFSEA